jgi:pilus assembly protein CpaE
MLDSLRAARKNDLPPRFVLNGVGMIAILPFDAKLFGTAANNGQMIGEVEGGAKTAQIFNDLGRTVTGRVAARREKKGLLDPLLARLKM